MNTSNNVHTIGLVRVHYRHCDSTQTRLQNILSKTSPKQGLVISSDYQSEGRGQLDSKWSAIPDSNIAFSMLFRPHKFPVEKQFFFNIWSSLAIVQALENILIDQDIKVKWPNDIMVNDQKLGGILIQSSLRSNTISHLVLGLGLNVNEPMNKYLFAATSLRDICHQTFHLPELRENLISAVYNRCQEGLSYRNYQKSENDFIEKLWKLGQTVEVLEAGKRKSCVIIGLEPSGELIVEIEGQKRAVRHKEIEFLIP